MKCQHCEEELGLNNTCINPTCSYFGTTIKSSENTNDIEKDSDKSNGYNSTSNADNSNISPNFNNGYDNRINYDNNQSIDIYTNIYSNQYNDDNNISTQEFVAFIGNHKTNYYIDLIPKMEHNNKFLSWNWSCFLLAPYWLLYRKLYALAAVLIVLGTGSSILFHSKISIILMLIIRIILSIFANAIYINNSKRKIRNIKMNINNLSTTQYINRLHKKGGVNSIAPIILLVLYMIITMFFIVSIFLFTSVPHPYDNFSAPSYYF